MKHIISINGCGFSYSSFEEYALAMKRNGIDGTDMEFPTEFFRNEQEAVSGGKLMEELGLSWGIFKFPGEILSDEISDEDFVKCLDVLKYEAEIALAAGCKKTFSNLWSGSNKRKYAENLDWMLHRLSKAWEILRPLGIQYGVEALGPLTLQKTFSYPFARSLAGAIGLLDMIDMSLGFVFDSFHWYCAGARYDDITLAKANAHRIITVHINDAMPGGIELQQDLQRGMPLENGIINTRELLRELKKSGYDGPVTIEPLYPWKEKLGEMEIDKAMETVSRFYIETMPFCC